MREIIIVFQEEDGETTYQINNENGEYCADAETLDEVMIIAKEMAEVHDIEFIKVQAETEKI